MDAARFFVLSERNYPKAKKRFDEIDPRFQADGVYRVYHHSFKMYSELQRAITEYLGVLFELTDLPVESVEYRNALEWARKLRRTNIVKKLKTLNPDRVFYQTMNEALGVKFDFYKQDNDTWHEHQLRLTSGLIHAKTAVSSIVKVAGNYYRRKHIPTGRMDEAEAICEHVMNFEGYRWENESDLVRRIEKMKKNKKLITES